MSSRYIQDAVERCKLPIYVNYREYFNSGNGGFGLTCPDPYGNPGASWVYNADTVEEARDAYLAFVECISNPAVPPLAGAAPIAESRSAPGAVE